MNEDAIKIAVRMTGNPERFAMIADTVNGIVSHPERMELIFCSSDEEFASAGEDVRVAACYRIFPEIFNRLTGLKWIYFGGTGIEHSLFPEIIESDVILTKAVGFHSGTTAEFAFAMMLFLERRLGSCLKFKAAREWNQAEIARNSDTLNGKRLGIIGFGHVGPELAKRAKAFGMKVTATYRSASAGDTHPDADEIIPKSELDRLLQESDYVAVCAPLTGETRRLIGARELALMKPTAYLINIGRGAVVDEGTLTEALREGRIAGAGIDVYEKEPLPGDSPLFELENVFLSPHIAGNFSGYTELAAADFGENLERYMQGEKLLNIVDKAAGY